MQCSVCRHQSSDTALFCEQCGKPLRRDRASMPAMANPPPHLAEKILSSREGLEGERKQVTVLFADVKSSTELAASLDPEEWVRIVERLSRLLCEGVHRFEETVDNFTGDGIMALFGRPSRTKTTLGALVTPPCGCGIARCDTPRRPGGGQRLACAAHTSQALG
jgi:class 3 adenylate cyclase